MSTGHFQEFEDEYLETMYEFYEKDPELRVRTGSLAESLKISPASATEMVQRLASKGFLDYVPYKGSSLTTKGLEHGKMMKRRHRLAEVLLEHLPFDGNHHETACRLEHAIDDDLDVALSVYLGNPELDPSGRDIPDIRDDLSQRLSSKSSGIRKMSNMQNGESGKVAFMSLSQDEIDIISQIGIEVGTEIKFDGEYKIQSSNKIIKIDESVSSFIVLHLHV
jgi:DtxR family Mn-dependent transcriptional regulator|tara:strand:+ start:46 stop:711 length:666 start_codon:yes stop_codon:yes gene_type:complete